MKRIGKRFMAAVLVLVLVLSLVPMSALAAETGIPDTTWYDNDPYAEVFSIATADELAGLAELVNGRTDDFNGKTIYLTTDIDLSDYGDGEGWSLIGHALWGDWGWEITAFNGTFNGDGYTISGLTIAADPDEDEIASFGLFGAVGWDGAVKNLTVETCDISAPARVGAVAGYNEGLIENCMVTGSSTISGAESVGGVVGFDEWGVIQNCYNTGTVSGDEYVGGVVGCTDEDSIVRNCYNTGAVSGVKYVGGVVGYNSWYCAIQNCYNTGAVSGGEYVGGVVGYDDEGSVTNTYFVGTNNADGVGGSEIGDADTTAMSLDEMKTDGFRDLLNEHNPITAVEWRRDTSNAKNGGLPYIYTVPCWTDRGVRATGFSSTDTNKINITSEAELGLFAYNLSQNPACYDGYTITLTTDLDLTAHRWRPVDMVGVEFMGGGKAISGLAVADAIESVVPVYDKWQKTEYVAGMFGVLELCNIYDLVFDTPNVSISQNADLNCLMAGVIAGLTYGTQIRRIEIIDPLVSFRPNGYDSSGSSWSSFAFLGGAVGYIHSSTNENSDGNHLTILNGVEIHGGEVSIVLPDTLYGTESIYVGGIAGASYTSCINSSSVYYTKVAADEIGTGVYTANLCVGGIVGYTSTSSYADLGACVLNSLSMAELEAADSISIDTDYAIHGKKIGGIAAVVNDDSVVNNLYIGAHDLFGHISNDDGFTDEPNYVYADIDDALDNGVYGLLNNDTEDTGGMWIAAKVADEDAGYGMPDALTKFKLWHTYGEGERYGAKTPYLGAYYIAEKPTVGRITAPLWRDEAAIMLAAPAVTEGMAPTTAQGWQISDDGVGGWVSYTIPATADISLNGKFLRYCAENSYGASYSNVVKIKVFSQYAREVIIEMWDSYDDSWNGAAIRVMINGEELKPHATLDYYENGKMYSFIVEPEDSVEYFWVAGDYDNEIAFAVYYAGNGDITFDNGEAKWSNTEDAIFYKDGGDMNGFPGGRPIYPDLTYWTDDDVRAEDADLEIDDDEKTIEIANADQLGLFAYKLMNDPECYDGYTVTLTGNINLTGHYWMPVDMVGVEFMGGGKAISGLRVIDSIEYGTYYYTAGMFGTLDRCRIDDLRLVNPVVDIYESNNYRCYMLGAIAGQMLGARLRNVVIENPTVKYSQAAYSYSMLGGVTGYAQPSDDSKYTAEYQFNDTLTMSVLRGVDVHGGEVSLMLNAEWTNAAYLGGIAGANYDSVIASSSVNSTVIAMDTSRSSAILNDYYVGGIAGYTSAKNPVGTCLLNNLSMADIDVPNYIYSYYNNIGSGKEDAISKYIGGVCGFVNEDHAVNNLYIGALNDGTDTVVGLFGSVNAGDYIVSHNYAYKTITDAYAEDGIADGNEGTYSLYEALNDDTDGTGGLFKAAEVYAGDSEGKHDIDDALTKFRIWHTYGAGGRYTAKTPYLGLYYVHLLPLEGSVEITGTVRIGQTLTATPDGFDGQGDPIYQWSAGGVDIDGATNSTYQIAAADVGKTITVTVTAAGYSGSLTDTTVAVPYTINLVKSGNTGTDDVFFGTSGTMTAYAASGDVTIGYVLSGGGSKSNGIAYTGGTVTAATTAGSGSSTYTVSAADATDGVITITAAFSHENKADVSITETEQTKTYNAAEQGFTITGTPDSGFTVTYNGSSTVPTNAGTYDVVITRDADANYNAYSKTVTGGLVISPADISGTPAITIGGGQLQVGAVLTASTGGMTPTTGYAYQWSVGGTAIDGATSSTYTVAAADLGRTITVAVTASGNYTGSEASNATAKVPYKVVVVDYPASGGDSVTGKTAYSDAGGDVTFAFTLANTAIINTLRMGHGIAITNTAATSHVYTVMAAHATDGVITLTPEFVHENKLSELDLTDIAPVTGAEPTTTLLDNTYYTGTAVWSPTVTGGKFLEKTAYTAEVTLTATDGVTFDQDFEPVADSGTVTDVSVSGDGATVSFSVTFGATGPKTISRIDVETSDNFVRKSGVILDVPDLVITITYNDGTTTVLSHGNGNLDDAEYKIGAEEVFLGQTRLLAAKHHDEPISVTYSTEENGSITYSSSSIGVALKVMEISIPLIIGELTEQRAIILTAISPIGINLSTEADLIFRYRKIGTPTWIDAMPDAGAFDIGGLEPNTQYIFEIAAEYKADRTISWSFTVPFRTLPVPASAPEGYEVSGTVTDDSSIAGIFVTLEHGNTVIASQFVTGSSSFSFSFSDVPDGIYNLVVFNGVYKVTQAITVNGRAVVQDIDMSAGRTQSIVKIEGDSTPPAAVGGLPELFEDDAGIVEQADKDVVTGGGTVEIKLVVEKKDEAAVAADAALIQDEADGQIIGLLLDLSVIKSQLSPVNALLDETKLTDLNGNLLTITFELPAELVGKSGIKLYRVHDDGTGAVAEALTEFAPGTWNGTDEGFTVDGRIVTLYVCKFSTYALGYTPDAPIVAPNTGSVVVEKTENGKVTANSVAPAVGRTVIITVTPDDGYMLDKLTVTDANGKEIAVLKNANGTYSFIQPDGKVTVRVTFKAIEAEILNGLLITDEHVAYINGKGGGKFEPKANLTRAEVVQMFYNLLRDKNVDVTVSFPDVSAGQWYANAAGTLASLGIIKGYTDGSFRPGAAITRAEFVAIATRFAELIPSEQRFTDVDEGHWAFVNINAAAEFGWINGTGEGRFEPDRSITRAEAVAVVNRMLNRTPDKAFIDASTGLARFSDVPLSDWAYYEIIEAANAHDYERVDNTELWK